MKPGGPLKRTAFVRKSPIPSTGMLSVQSHQRKAPARKAAMKSKQRAVTADEKDFWSRLASLGCIACMKDGNLNPHVSIHHCDGRTKPGCHKLVLPLCAPHHQRDDADPMQRIAIHPDKARFEARYGTQTELMALCAHLLKTTKSEAVTGLQPDAASVK